MLCRGRPPPLTSCPCGRGCRWGAHYPFIIGEQMNKGKEKLPAAHTSFKCFLQIYTLHCTITKTSYSGQCCHQAKSTLQRDSASGIPRAATCQWALCLQLTTEQSRLGILGCLPPCFSGPLRLRLPTLHSRGRLLPTVSGAVLEGGFTAGSFAAEW